MLSFTVTLVATYSQSTFKKFFLISEAPNHLILQVPTGRFEIDGGSQSEIYTKFSSEYPNTVIETNTVPKTNISVS